LCTWQMDPACKAQKQGVVPEWTFGFSTRGRRSNYGSTHVEPLKRGVLTDCTHGSSARRRCWTCWLFSHGAWKTRSSSRLDSRRAIKTGRFSNWDPIILFSFLTRCYYPHTLRDVVYPICRIFQTKKKLFFVITYLRDPV
jgi:hypothetical protein